MGYQPPEPTLLFPYRTTHFKAQLLERLATIIPSRPNRRVLAIADAREQIAVYTDAPIEPAEQKMLAEELLATTHLPPALTVQSPNYRVTGAWFDAVGPQLRPASHLARRNELLNLAHRLERLDPPLGDSRYALGFEAPYLERLAQVGVKLSSYDELAAFGTRVRSNDATLLEAYERSRPREQTRLSDLKARRESLQDSIQSIERALRGKDREVQLATKELRREWHQLGEKLDAEGESFTAFKKEVGSTFDELEQASGAHKRYLDGRGALSQLFNGKFPLYFELTDELTLYLPFAAQSKNRVAAEFSSVLRGERTAQALGNSFSLRQASGELMNFAIATTRRNPRPHLLAAPDAIVSALEPSYTQLGLERAIGPMAIQLEEVFTSAPRLSLVAEPTVRSREQQEAAITRVLASAPEPLSRSKLFASIPVSERPCSIDRLTAILREMRDSGSVQMQGQKKNAVYSLPDEPTALAR